jgi:hypothetical protein
VIATAQVCDAVFGHHEVGIHTRERDRTVPFPWTDNSTRAARS